MDRTDLQALVNARDALFGYIDGEGAFDGAQEAMDGLRGVIEKVKADIAVRQVNLGSGELGSSLNPGLDDCFKMMAYGSSLVTARAGIDQFLLNLSLLLQQFGYDLRVVSTAQPDRSTVMPNWGAQSACTIPPPGWRCTRESGHSGPCAAVPVSEGKEI